MAKKERSTHLTQSDWQALGFTIARDGKLYGVPTAAEVPAVSDDCACCGCGDDQPCLCDHGADCPSCPDSDCPCCQQAEAQS